jgi:nicotinate-nucleotide adenylyltransferase
MIVRRKIGLFGGSFDPIHTGHLILAEAARETAGLSTVYFIPTAVPPHKRRVSLSCFDMRMRMVELAIADNPAFELSLLEGKEEVSYTFESVLFFHEKGYGKEQIHLLIGSDSLEEIRSWKKPEIIFGHATIIALVRPDHRTVPPLPENAAVIILESGSNMISSSDIRRYVHAGRSIRYLVPAPVERFIAEQSLYCETR